MQELRIALRRLGRRPARSLAAGAALAIGIGATAAAFTAVNDVLLRDLPVNRQDELVVVWHLNPERGSLEIPFRPQSYDAVARGSGSLSAVAGFSAWGTMPAVVESPDADQVLRVVRVAGDFFGVLGGRPAIGRLLEAADDRVGAVPVAVLSHRAWRGRYGADPGVIGSTLVLDGIATTVVGAAAEGLGFPIGVWATRFVESLLFGVVPADPATLVAVFTGSLVLALVAGTVPAVRASSAEPAVALRLD